jgi:hypothetical protein
VRHSRVFQGHMFPLIRVHFRLPMAPSMNTHGRSRKAHGKDDAPLAGAFEPPLSTPAP